MLHVDVRDNNVDQALRVLKKRCSVKGFYERCVQKNFTSSPQSKKHGRQKRQLSVNAKPIELESPNWAFECGRKSACITYTNQLTVCYNSDIFRSCV